ncbi:MAG: ABC transporter permease [Chloroflexi bacterium]|nr:ABC transporter permease [Chloroflexota bacterium]
MSWEKIWLVLRREYLYNFKRPSFLFTAFGVPLLTLVAMFLIFTFTADRETNLDNWQRVGYIDRAGVIDPALAVENDVTFQPVTDPALDTPAADAPDDERRAYFDALEASAAQQVAADNLDAYFVVDEHYTLNGQVTVSSERNLPAALTSDIEDFMRAQIAAQAPAELPVSVERLSDPMSVVIRDLDNDEELTETMLVGRIMLPFVFVFIYFMATSTTSQFLMSGVVEEKENRLMEILATSLRPLELLWGKMLGLGALSLTQVALWAGAGVVLASLHEGASELFSGTTFQAGDILLVLVLFVTNFLLFAAIMMAIGAAVTAEAESRQVASVITLITVAPMALLVTFFNNPDGPLPLFFTFFPLTSAVGLILRMGLTTIPTWQIVAVLAIQVVSVLVLMWLAAKIFRLGMLMYGKPLTPRTFWNALREGRVVLTTATESQAELPDNLPQKRSVGR